jgi:hypothetical protein
VRVPWRATLCQRRTPRSRSAQASVLKSVGGVCDVDEGAAAATWARYLGANLCMSGLALRHQGLRHKSRVDSVPENVEIGTLNRTRERKKYGKKERQGSL